MRWVLAVQLIFVVIVLALLFKQILLPLAQGRPLFPWFRSREAALVRERAEVLEDIAEKRLEEEIEELRKKIKGGTQG
jgi:hypothetical protein